MTTDSTTAPGTDSSNTSTETDSGTETDSDSDSETDTDAISCEVDPDATPQCGDGLVAPGEFCPGEVLSAHSSASRRRLSAADINADGAVDILVASEFEIRAFYNDGTGALQDLAELDELSDQLSQSYGGARLEDIDLDKLARQLGDQAAVDARTLQELERALRESGYLNRGSDGNLKLSPKAMRQLGKALLKDVANKMSGRQGQRDLRAAGAAGDLSGASRPWVFGDTEPWDVTRTITNAVVRTSGSRAPGERIRIQMDDIEVAETEARTQAAVALLVDTSFSMAMAGRWVPMKRTALALHQLITSRFRGDHLQLIGFGRAAQVMNVEELTGLDARYDKGTNLHHALLLANRHFRKHPNAQPVLLIVTDGEPTSHLASSGEVLFAYPPHPMTIAHTVRELDNSRRLGAQTTFFRLGDDPGLARFIEELADRVEGNVVSPELDDLGAAVVGSFLSGRGGRSSSPFGHMSDLYGGRGFWYDS